jgi:hypothetical protein
MAIKKPRWSNAFTKEFGQVGLLVDKPPRHCRDCSSSNGHNLTASYDSTPGRQVNSRTLGNGKLFRANEQQASAKMYLPLTWA